ncbi:hypothetical protein SPFM9_00152 [Salmonella phage SPFM9]|nr:hypothetical protein SPFM9_00152 [Salmonella phage SPFM9]
MPKENISVFLDKLKRFNGIWVLSWVPGREQLYFLRKFPRGDFFQEKKPYRDIFRTLKACAMANVATQLQAMVEDRCQLKRVTGGRLYVGKHRSRLITWSLKPRKQKRLQFVKIVHPESRLREMLTVHP